MHVLAQRREVVLSALERRRMSVTDPRIILGLFVVLALVMLASRREP